MNARLRIGHSHGYHSYREVEPVPAYPRIDPQQPRDQYPRRQNDQRSGGEDLTRRRFTAMRRVIDDLKKEWQIIRVDHQTADSELTQSGFQYAEETLVEHLLELPLNAATVEDVLAQIRRHPQRVQLQLGERMSEANNWLPVAVDGLSSYSLFFSDLQLAAELPNHRVIAAIEAEGRYVSSYRHCTLTLKRLPGKSSGLPLTLTVEIPVAVAESDENGRRVLLYPRDDGHFALYADKQIDLSI